MALEINMQLAASTAGLNPRIPINQIPTDFNEWSVFSSGGGSDPTVSGTNGDRVTCTKTSSAGRSWVGTAVPVVAGRSYAFGVTTVSRSVTPTVPDIWTNASVSAGAATLTTVNTGVRFCLRFTAAATGNVTLRLGIGPGSNETNASQLSWVAEKPFFYEIDSVTGNCPDYVCNLAVASWQQGAAAFSFANGNVVRTTGNIGQVDENSSGDVPLTPRPYTVGLFVSDSFGNAETEWPNLLAQTDGHLVLMGNATGGDSMADFDTRFADVIALDAFDYTGDIQPSFVIIQSSLNSPNESTSVADMLTTITSMIDKAKTADLVPVVTNIPPLGNATTFTNAKGKLLAAYNNRIKQVCAANGAAFVDIFSLLVAPDGYSLKEEYRIAPTDIHPNEAGMQAIANKFAQTLRLLRSAPTTAGGGPLVRDLLGNEIPWSP